LKRCYAIYYQYTEPGTDIINLSILRENFYLVYTAAIKIMKAAPGPGSEVLGLQVSPKQQESRNS
jgi:hypothetical protein